MARPRLCRKIGFHPEVEYFKPQGVAMSELELVSLDIEELEAYRLRHLNNLDQSEAAKEMNISTSTYQRIIYSAYGKIADALINGKAIKILK